MNRALVLGSLIVFAAAVLLVAPFVGIIDVPISTLWDAEASKAKFLTCGGQIDVTSTDLSFEFP